MAELSKFAEEIMVEILSRLPPKSLMRFKCVRKSWQCLINNSDFAARHLSITKNNKHPSSITIAFTRRVLEDINSSKKRILLSLFDVSHCNDGDDELDPIVEDIHSPVSAGLVDWQRFRVNISTHCDGILCLTDGGKYIVLCNPAIKEFKLLPVPSSNSISYGEGFGYDLKSKDYKVVRILSNGREEYMDGMHKRVVIRPPTVEVYSLLTNSWKEIKIDNLITKTTIYWPQSYVSVYHKGILYWCGHEELRRKNFIVSDYSEDEEDDEGEMKDSIISFDIGDEAFYVISFPGDCRLYGCGLGLWKESIALCTSGPWSPDPSTKETLEIWLMDDLGGGEGSWTKYLTFEPVVAHIIGQLGLFWDNKQLVAIFKTNCAVIFYEVCTNKFKCLPLNTEILDYSQAVECTRSIVSIK
ncbi:F-box/kelch-repeat protein At3g23880-like [Rosa rugosa]|uniref:F-box/kelch-repeat protein At3g23880-like n=1 Tax=Rosa rugosa TaxID=74645 RepID=UPI002B40FE96|nr:F-box/kelch-repeat protein At3g23880-like [Rosa rugosa]